MTLELASLGDNIRKARQRLKISQDALAERCGLHRTYITDIERGARNVSFGSLLKVAQGLGTTVSELTSNIESASCGTETSAGVHANISATARGDEGVSQTHHNA